MNKIILYTIPFIFTASIITACSVEKPETTNEHQINQPNTIVKNSYRNKAISEPNKLSPQRFSIPSILKAHNAIRYQHGLSPLTWSNDLAKISRKWADKLGSGNSCKMYHQSGNLPFGENLFISSATIWSDGKTEVSAVSINEVVGSWASEQKLYNYKTNTCQAGQQCGHYTQIVWKETKELGCSVKVCADKSQVWVCNYFPTGNIIGERPY